MKRNKILSLILAALMLALAACGAQPADITGENDTEKKDDASTLFPAPEQTPNPEQAPAPLGAEAAELRFASEYAEIFEALMTAGSGGYRGMPLADGAETEEAVAEEPAAADSAAATAAGLGGDAEYSGTNVQVAGIDEGDIVKTDGSYIYVLSGDNALSVIKADGRDSYVVTRLGLGESAYEDSKDRWLSESKTPREMFVSDGVLAVISNYYRYEESYADDVWSYDSDEHCCVDFYDVSDPAEPRHISSLGQDGSILATRLLDGRLYLVSNYWVWDYDEDEPITFVPRLYENGEARAMEADCIAICGTGSTRYAVVGCYDLASGSLTASQSLLGGGSTVYMNGENLYVLGSTWREEELRSYTESVYTVTEYRSGSVTDIYRFDLSGGLSLAASGSIPGSIDSQFSADEWNGNLRVVATRDESAYSIYRDPVFEFENYRYGGSSTGTGLYILDRGLNLVGSVTDLAPDEFVYSARFDGEMAYFSTFRTVDPLFAVDCSDPANPTVLSALKISGFSEYLHAWTPERLFGFGREADESTGRAGGLKLVMFDTSNKADVTARHTLNLDAVYSEALYNHRAFFISPEKNIIGFLGEDDYYIFAYDDDYGFTQLSHFWFDIPEYNVRGLYIGDTAYIVGHEEMMVIDMNTWDAPEPVNIGIGMG